MSDEPSEEVMSAAKSIMYCCTASAVVICVVIAWAIFV